VTQPNVAIATADAADTAAAAAREARRRRRDACEEGIDTPKSASVAAIEDIAATPQDSWTAPPFLLTIGDLTITKRGFTHSGYPDSNFSGSPMETL